MKTRARSKKRAVAEINVVPYIDVMLVLLVIFIATAPVVMQGVSVDLPKAEAETMNEDQKTPIIATVDKAGQYFVSIDTTNVKMPSLDDVSKYVANELQKDPTRPVVVQGDAKVPYDSVIQLRPPPHRRQDAPWGWRRSPRRRRDRQCTCPARFQGLR